MRDFNEAVKKHLTENIIVYGVVIFFFIVGVSLGALAVNNINISTKLEVRSYIESFLSISATSSISSSAVLKSAMKFNLYTTAFIFLAGITYFGILLTPMLSLMRGFTLGFTIAFLTDSLGLGGFVLSLISILPQNLFYIPALFFLCVCSINLSMSIIKNKYYKRYNDISKSYFVFSVVSLIVFAIFAAGCIIESYINPALIRIATQYLIN